MKVTLIVASCWGVCMWASLLMEPHMWMRLCICKCKGFLRTPVRFIHRHDSTAAISQKISQDKRTEISVVLHVCPNLYARIGLQGRPVLGITLQITTAVCKVLPLDPSAACRCLTGRSPCCLLLARYCWDKYSAQEKSCTI